VSHLPLLGLIIAGARHIKRSAIQSSELNAPHSIYHCDTVLGHSLNAFIVQQKCLHRATKGLDILNVRKRKFTTIEGIGEKKLFNV
jgi:hypothetical protein